MQDAASSPKGFEDSSRHARRAIDGIVSLLVAACVVVPLAAPCMTRAADAEPVSPPQTAFQPGDISIGEPIALPFSEPTTVPSASAPPSAARTAAPPASATAAPGWLGMSVAESATPGRWTIVEVVPSGPAAVAGIVTGDELRGVNGRTLASADDVSEAITAITVGQQVRLSMARAERVSDIDVVAMPRPSASAPGGLSTTGLHAGTTGPMPAVMTPPSGGPAVGRGWQPATETPPAVAASAPNGAATVSVLTNPPLPNAPLATTTAPPIAASAPAPLNSAPLSTATPGTAAIPAGRTGFAEPATVSPGPVSPAPWSPATGSAAATRGRTALGVRTVPIDRDIQERFRLPAQAGAYVIGVVGELPASKAGIPPGSVIVAIADRPVRSPQELTQLVAAGPTDRPVPLHYILPGGTEKRADVVLQSLERPLEEALIGEPALQPSSAPVFQPSPNARTSQRPESPGAADANEIRREVVRVRALLESLERRLDRIGR